MPTFNMLLKTVKMEFSPGKTEEENSFQQNPRGEEITVNETHRILLGGQKSLLQKRDRQKYLDSNVPINQMYQVDAEEEKKKGGGVRAGVQ